MGHINGDHRSRFEKTPRAWLKVGTQFNDVVNGWADRSDLITFLGEGAGHGTVAAFNWREAEIEVNVDLAFGEGFDPTFLPDLTVRKNQFEYPAAMGAVFHEAAHARFTKYNRVSLAETATPTELLIVRAFEETRIEKNLLAVFPKNKALIRATALDLVLNDVQETENFSERGILSFAHLILLSLARVDCGSLKERDVKVISKAFKQLFDKPTRKKLQSIWKRAQAHSEHTTWEPLLDLAKEFIETLKEAGQDPEDEEQDNVPEWLKELLKALSGEGSGSESGEGEGDGEGESGEGESGGGSGGQSLLEQMAEQAQIGAQGDANAQLVEEVREAAAAARAEQAAEARTHAETSSEVYGRGSGPAGRYTNSSLVEERMPTSDERRAAVALSKELEKAKYRDRAVTRTTSIIPPGRLNARQMLAGAEQRSRGAEITAQPFARKQRKHTDEPELTIGALVDISGSMHRAMEPMASMAWILSEATKRVQGKCSMVYYGDDVFPVLKPGQHFDKVKVYDAPDGSEQFDKAFKALDGALNLLHGDGARLLVVVSDLYYYGFEIDATKKWMQRCRDAGVAVIVVPFGHDSTAESALRGIKGIELIKSAKTSGSIVNAAMEVGKAAVRQLQVVSASR